MKSNEDAERTVLDILRPLDAIARSGQEGQLTNVEREFQQLVMYWYFRANGGLYAASGTGLPLGVIRMNLLSIGATRSVPALDELLGLVPESDWSNCWGNLVSLLGRDEAYEFLSGLDRRILEDQSDYFPRLVEFYQSHRDEFPHSNVPGSDGVRAGEAE